MIPGCVTTQRLPWSISRTRFIRVRAIVRAPSMPEAPPLRPVPAPRGTTGMRYSAARPTRAATSAVDSGSATASGSPAVRYVVSSSRYDSRSVSSVRRRRFGSWARTASRNAARTACGGAGAGAPGADALRRRGRGSDGRGHGRKDTREDDDGASGRPGSPAYDSGVTFRSLRPLIVAAIVAVAIGLPPAVLAPGADYAPNPTPIGQVDGLVGTPPPDASEAPAVASEPPSTTPSAPAALEPGSVNRSSPDLSATYDVAVTLHYGDRLIA